jgi:hypothetical protein
MEAAKEFVVHKGNGRVMVLILIHKTYRHRPFKKESTIEKKR